MKQKLHSDLNTLLNFYRKNKENCPEEFTHKAGLISKPGFFRLADFQNHLNNPLLKPEWLHIKRNGKTISTDEAVHSKNVQMRHLYFMDKEIINREIEKGAALVLEGIDILDSGINSFCSMIEKGLPCGMANSVVFFSQKGNEAYEPHADTNDVIVVQLEGKKTWYLYEPRQRAYFGSANLSNEQLGQVKHQVTLRPGDAMYVRTGVPHHCVTDTNFSLHMAFDLLDRTPEPPLFTSEANRLYNFACVEAYSPASDIVDKYIDILKSPEFQDDLIKETASIRTKNERFRETISRASSVRSLSKLK